MVLCIEQSKSAAAARDYFTKHLAPGDYYVRGSHSLSQWFGKELARVGLKEGQEVTAKDFGAIASNRMPGTGERLTVLDAAKRKPGYEFMVAPPKSVSSMWARTADPRIPAMVMEATKEWLREDVEPDIKTRVRRGGQQTDITVGNLIASLHPHLTTRELKEDKKPDPQIHLHVYAHNVCWADHEERFQAVQFGGLVADKGYYEAAWESRVAAKMREIGYEVEKDGQGRWELSAVPDSVNARFSRRRFAEILPEAEKRGITDAAGRKNLGRQTRQAKGESEELPTEQLHAYWNAKLTSDETVPMDAAYTRSLKGGSGGQRRQVTAREAIAHALEHYFGPDGRQCAVAENAVIEEALRYGAGDVLAREARRALEARREVIRAEIGGRMVLTTEEALAEEQAVKKSAWSGRDACAPLLAGIAYLPEAARDGQITLDPEQTAAIGAVLSSRDRIMALTGKSGAGKSTTLRGLDKELRERGRRICAFAPTTTASRRNLRDKGFSDATTLQALLVSPKLQQACRGNIILIDEATQAGTRAIRQVFDLVERHQAEGYDTRALLVGDPMQHRGVPRGEIFTILKDQAGLEPVARLNTIRRQKDNPEYLRAVELLSVGKTGEAFDLLDRLGFIHEITDPEERYRQMARDYADGLKAGTSEMIVSPTHAEGRAVMAAVRHELKTRELLGADDRELVRYESKDRSIAQRKDAAQYDVGDVVQWGKAPGFKCGERLSVVGSDNGVVQVRRADGQVKELPLQHADKFELYRATSLPVADGERLRITRNGVVTGRDGKAHRINNGDIITVRFTADGDLVDQRGWIIPANFGHLASGVVTSHASQSLEDEVPFLAQSTTSRGASNARQFYVSVSRGTHALRLYTDDKEAVREAVMRSDQARSAYEVWQARERQAKARERSGWEALTRRKRKRRGLWALARAAQERIAGSLRELGQALRGQEESRGLRHA
jgi:conjugative relaxase-like TrwC/TraI family protein